jgi:hypothetical protein
MSLTLKLPVNLGSWLLETHFAPAASRCPKTSPPRCPQIADSTGVRFADIAAHKQMFAGTLKNVRCSVSFNKSVYLGSLRARHPLLPLFSTGDAVLERLYISGRNTRLTDLFSSIDHELR